MSNMDRDFQARAKRVRAQTGLGAPMPARRRVVKEDSGESALILAVFRPQLAFLLGAVALVAGRAVAMRYLGVEPSTEVLGLREAGLVLVLLVGIGPLFGKSDHLSHGALVVGASLAFLLEGFYVPMASDLMSTIYTPDYVGRVVLGLP